MPRERRQNIRGRILKCLIVCQPQGRQRQNDIIRYPTESCVVFKATGNFTPARTGEFRIYR